jgi:cell division protein FtsB
MFICGLIALIAYGSIMLRGPQGLAALQEKHRMAHQLEEENATLQKEINEHKAFVEKLQHDPATQEKVVRERTGKTRPGDTSFVVPDQSSDHQ